MCIPSIIYTMSGFSFHAVLRSLCVGYSRIIINYKTSIVSLSDVDSEGPPGSSLFTTEGSHIVLSVITGGFTCMG